MPAKGQKAVGLTSMQQDVLAMFVELGGEATAYQIRLHAKRTRPKYGWSVTFQSNVDNRIQQLKKRGYLKYDPRTTKWKMIKDGVQKQGEGIQRSQGRVFTGPSSTR
jgi:hypothetical protein